MSNVARIDAKNETKRRAWSNSVVDVKATLAEEIRRQVAWVTLALRQIDQGDVSSFRDAEEALSWLMTISLEVDELEHERDCQASPTESHADAAAEE